MIIASNMLKILFVLMWKIPPLLLLQTFGQIDYSTRKIKNQAYIQHLIKFFLEYL